MLHTIGALRAADGDPIAHLLACHARIRRFTGVAASLVDADVPSAELAEAAAAVARYFTVGLPLHAADEDESMRPLLVAAGVPAAIERALAAMTAEHGPIEALVAQGAPLWRAVAAAPAARFHYRAELSRVARGLAAAFAGHLRVEEELIFPAVRARLAPAALARLRDEMRSRRAGR
jgi:hypothetical protein